MTTITIDLVKLDGYWFIDYPGVINVNSLRLIKETSALIDKKFKEKHYVRLRLKNIESSSADMILVKKEEDVEGCSYTIGETDKEVWVSDILWKLFKEFPDTISVVAVDNE